MYQIQKVLFRLLTLSYGLNTIVKAVDLPGCVIKKISKVGCFNQYSPYSKDMIKLFSERKDIVWGKHGFANFVDKLVCRCAFEASKGGYAFFSIRHFGLCIVNKDYQNLVNLVQGATGRNYDCIKGDGGFEPCDKTKNDLCVGPNDRDFFYTIADDPWSQWSGCSATCGQGNIKRTRMYPYPTEESQNCILNPCPNPGKCKFEPGDGKSELEWYLGNITSKEACIDACEVKRNEMPHINGVKMYTSQEPGCWCKIGVQKYSSMDNKETFQTCILETSKACGPFNGGCNQKCKKVYSKYKCSCNSGFVLQDDKKTCHDINECMTTNGGCDHECVNEEGGYTCKCNKGYTLKPNKKGCQASKKL